MLTNLTSYNQVVISRLWLYRLDTVLSCSLSIIGLKIFVMLINNRNIDQEKACTTRWQENCNAPITYQGS